MKNYSILSQISPELAKYVRSHSPAPGQVVRFELEKIKTVDGKRVVPNRVRLLPYCTINDGGAKTIEFIRGFKPNVQGREPITDYGNVEFTREQNGLITISGDSAADLELFYFLFLHPANTDNVGKEWYIRPRVGGKFHRIKTSAVAKTKVDSRRLRREAEEIVDNLGRVELMKLVYGFGIRGVTQNTSDDEIKDMIYLSVVETHPERILGLDDDRVFKVMALINQAIDQNLLSYSNKQWKWTGQKTIIMVALDDKTAKDALCEYLMGVEGMSVMKHLEKMVKNIKAPAPEPAKSLRKLAPKVLEMEPVNMEIPDGLEEEDEEEEDDDLTAEIEESDEDYESEEEEFEEPEDMLLAEKRGRKKSK